MLVRYSLYLILYWFQRSRFYRSRPQIHPGHISSSQQARERPMFWMGQLLDTAVLYGCLYTSLLVLQPKSPEMAGLSAGLFELVSLLLAQALIVEPLYYGYHRFLHRPRFFRAHHHVHHQSVITQACTAISFTWLERLSYTLLFAIPLLLVSVFGHLSLVGLLGFIVCIDCLNYMGHFNREILGNWYFKSPLRYVFYSATFHTVHHRDLNRHYSLFMPIWDHLFNTT